MFERLARTNAPYDRQARSALLRPSREAATEPIRAKLPVIPLASARNASRLPVETLLVAEAGFKRDLGAIRLHDDGESAALTSRYGARALTYGSDIFMARDAPRPGVPAGDRLLAHELTHAVRQSREGQPSVQLDKASTSQAEIGANDILPYPAGARVQIINLLQPSLLDAIQRFAKGDYGEVLAALKSDQARSVIATIGESSADKVAASMDTPQIPAEPGRPAIAPFHVDVELQRQSDRSFEAMISWRGPTQGREWFPDIVASRDGGGRVVLSTSKEGPRLAIGAPDKKGERIARVENLPWYARLAVKDPLELVAMREVTAPAGSTAEKKETATAVAESRKRFAEKAQQVAIGAGAQKGYQLDPVLTAGWSFTFKPLSNAVQVPVMFQLDYVPPKSLLLGAATGLQVQAPTKIPVQLRVLGGFKAGEIAEGGPGVSRADRPLKGARGPTIGAGASVDFGSVTLELDYEHMVNLVKDGPNVKRVNLSAGFRF